MKPEGMTDKQWQVIRYMNPFEEHPLNQKEIAIVLGISERTVKRIFRKFRENFPEAYEKFIKLKKTTNLMGRRLKNPWLFESAHWDDKRILFDRKVIRIWQ